MLFEWAGENGMDPRELEHLRATLMERRDFLAQDRSAKLSEVRQSADHTVADELDLAAETADFAVTVHAAFRDGQELDSIVQALKRIEDGTYGLCEDCRKTINPKRLQALPYVATCIECQRVAEKTGAVPRSAFRDQDSRYDDDGGSDEA